MKSIKAFAPATIANFNVGYDILGLSLESIGDEVELTINNSTENIIKEIINGDNLPYDSSKNCCSVVIRKMQEALNYFTGVDLVITKGFAAGSGLGSSSASSAAAAFAYNALIGKPFTTNELISFAAEGERIACGNAHIDNVAPALLGGLVLATNNTFSPVIPLPLIDNLFAVVLFPHIKIQTAHARKILRKSIDISTHSKQLSFMGTFVSSLYEKDIQLFSQSLKDLVITPMRSILIPHFSEMEAIVYENNGLSFGISGSGPSVFAIAEGIENAKQIENALSTFYQTVPITYDTYINPIEKSSKAKIITPLA